MTNLIVGLVIGAFCGFVACFFFGIMEDWNDDENDN